jgi:Holliday junction resolvase RusA-like endonuclease
MLEIIVYGRPAPQGSKRHVGNGVMIESSKAVKPWRDDVKAAAEKAIGGMLGDRYPLDAPLIVRMVFTMPKPASAPKRRRTWPCRTPDLSKLIRSTEDALTASGVWRDDARVVEYERTAKVFPGEDPEALDAPGVRITIRALDQIAGLSPLNLLASDIITTHFPAVL